MMGARRHHTPTEAACSKPTPLRVEGAAAKVLALPLCMRVCARSCLVQEARRRWAARRAEARRRWAARHKWVRAHSLSLALFLALSPLDTRYPATPEPLP
eukprot:COSAG02_NODE_10389_length_1951_cov_14.262419_2_plen_100_part_00